MLPKLFSLRELTYLSLSGCESLERLPKTDSLPSLKTLDLSRAKKFNEFREQTFGDCGGPKILDLSETSLENLPSKMNPCTLFLTHCSNLKILPLIEALKDLEVFDLSGTKSLVKIEGKLFDHLKSLRILNLSETGIKTLPSLSNLSSLCQLLLSGCTDLMVIEHESLEQMSGLRSPIISETGIKYLQFLSNPGNITVLSLKNCTSLKVLPPLESLSNLEELNLCGISLKETGAGFLEHMSSLRILDLSETQLQQLPSISNLRSLCQLYLRGCRSLKEVPGLDALTKLEVLDLSGTAVGKLPSFKDFSNLCQLMLADCAGLQEFLQREICDVGHLYLSNMKNVQGAGSSKMEEPNKYEGISSLAAETAGDNNKPCISVSSSQFLQILEKNPSFHFSIHPTVKQDRKGVASFYRDNFMFRDIFIQSSKFSEQQSLLLRGFSHSPEGIEDVYHADCSFLIDTEFKKCSSDLGASNLNILKGYWIERCREMDTNFYEEEVKEREVLWVSNYVYFERIRGNWQSDTFQNLRELYLDCCPKLSIVFSSSQLPKMLEVLQIKFCDELEAVFELASPKPELPYLQTLCLWELPKLKSLGCELPSLQTRKVWQCPKPEEFEENIKLDRSS